nr:LytTR family DNA-binding domain-containing protein [Sedimentibacter sp.]
MLKIVLHGDIQARKQIEPILSEYLSEKNIPFEVYSVGSAFKFLNKYFFQKDYQILFICKDNSISYISKIYHDFEEKYMCMVSGTLELPLTTDSIVQELFSNIEHTCHCPYGIYTVTTRKALHSITHEDIEYIRRINGKSTIYLQNGETQEVGKSMNKIMEELNEKYFVNCCKGYIVNIFNIKKVNKDTCSIKLKSGAEIPIAKRKFQQFLKAYSFSMQGVYKIWNN